MRACSADLRQRVLEACDGGMGTAAAATFAVSAPRVRRLKQRRQEAGGTAPGCGAGPVLAPAAHRDRWAALVREAPGRTAAAYFVGALTARGLIAPLVIGGGANGPLFRAYVERVLMPERRPGGVLVPDNLGSHTAAAVRVAAGVSGWCRRDRNEA